MCRLSVSVSELKNGENGGVVTIIVKENSVVIGSYPMSGNRRKTSGEDLVEINSPGRGALDVRRIVYQCVN